jgi:hypothetical protein
MGEQLRNVLGDGYEHLSWNDIEDVAERALAEVERLNAALRRIATYDVCVEHGYTDEWTEAEAFEACQEIARSATEATSAT